MIRSCGNIVNNRLIRSARSDHAVMTADSASDISSRPDLAPTSGPVRVRPRPTTVRASLLLFLRHRHCRRSPATAAAAASASPLSSRRTLPHDAQEAKSPSARSRRSAPQWAHQHISAEGAIATTPRVRRRNVPPTDGDNLYVGWLHLLGRFPGVPLRDRTGSASLTHCVLGFGGRAVWNVPP